MTKSNREQLGFGFGEHQEFSDYLAANKTDDGFEPTKKPEPTDAAPGTWSKVEVLAARLERGEELWHDLDRKIDLTKGSSSSDDSIADKLCDFYFGDDSVEEWDD